MGCCLQQSEPETSNGPTHNIQASCIFDSSLKFAALEQGKEETVNPSMKLFGIQTHNVHAPAVSDTFPQFTGSDREKEETSGLGDQLQRLPLYTDKNEQLIITSIRATDVALGLKRLPAGFYAVVYHNGLEWRTENKRSSAIDDVVEWCDPVPIPSDLTAIVYLEVYASFEFQHMLGTGEQLRRLTTTVEQLLDHSAKVPFTLFPEDGDVVSPCSSILVTVERRKCNNSDSPVSRVFRHHSTSEYHWKLEDATNQGHSALSRYRKHGEQQDLEHSIEQFEKALSTCPLDHPCRAAVQSNLAMAKFIYDQVEDMDALFDDPLGLYRDALASRPVGHADRPLTLVQLAMVHLARFEKQRDEVEGELAETLLHEAMELGCADGHEKRAATFLSQLHAGRRVGSVQQEDQPLMTKSSASHLTDRDLEILGIRQLHRFEQFGDLADSEQAIGVLRKSLGSTSIWNDLYRVRLTNLSAALLYRFEHLGEFHDLKDAISGQRGAVELTPQGHPNRPAYLNNLSNTILTRFERTGELSDLEDAISTQRDVVDLTPDGDPHKPIYLNNLGTYFLTRFEHCGKLSDLEDAISTLRDAVELTPSGHPDKPRRLSNLGVSFGTRFKHTGELGDLESAISRQKIAIELIPDGHPDKPAYLNNLGSSFGIRFKRFGELGDLEDAISSQRDAVELTLDGHPGKLRYLNNLGNSFLTRFNHLGELGDLDCAILTLGDVVDLTPDGHPGKSRCLTNLGISFFIRFKRFGELSDLEDAISNQRDAVELTPDGHPDRPTYLSNLGISFKTRFKRIGKLGDLENAISRQKSAVELTPDDHPDKPCHLNNLGNSLLTRFKHIGKLDDLENAISRQKDAVELTPDGHPNKPCRLSNLGNSFLTRFKHVGELDDLEDAISSQRDAVDLTPDSHPEKPCRLNDLGTSFRTRFERVGELNDLEDAISRQKDAVNLTSDGHPDKLIYLNNLGTSFLTRFERLGKLSDLEDAISTLRDAVELIPNGHPDKPDYLSNLGISFITRFERIGELGDLENAILRQKNAVELTPDGHPSKPRRLNNLGISFVTRFEHLRELGDLENAMLMLRDAVELTPDGHPDKPCRLNSLGNFFKTRFEHLGELGDLEGAISRQRDAVELTPDGHPDKRIYLNSLGNSFFTRFKHLGELEDLECAISRQSDAVELTPSGHPNKSTYLKNLGLSFGTRFVRLSDLSDLERAISLYSCAACASGSSIQARFSASQDWILYARCIRHPSLLHAYSVAIDLLPQLAWIGLSLTHRYSELMQGADVVRDAAVAALDSGLPETAVEWLEQGRSIVWGELFQLRSSYDQLFSAYPDHAHKLRELSARLEHASFAHEKSLSTLLERTEDVAHHAGETLQQEADRHRALAIERDKLLEEIRGFPGFERFLLQKEFSQLRASAHSGPVVILNAAERCCDALIVLADLEHVIHVPLPNFTLKRCTDLQNMLKNLVRHTRGACFQEREGQRARLDGVSWESFLSPLWKCVVKPILDVLAFSTPGDLAHIFWSPTGPFAFLPVHAAGFYDTEYSQTGNKVSDFVVSSYIPTLSILALSPNHSTTPTNDLRILAVRQPPSDGLSPLPGVVTELEHVKVVIKNSPSARTTLLESSVGTVEEVLDLMKEADWVHFACHGIQDAADSGLCLADRRRLKLRDILALSRRHGGLAFLSACQTAAGDEQLPDEAIHIAAGMLFAGYGGVIGTMWSISDDIAPHVARDVYEELFRNGTPDYRDAGLALHRAIQHVRERGASFDTWLPFIHVGL